MRINFSLIFLVLLLSYFIAGCKKSESCKVENYDTTRTDTLIDYNNASPHYLEKVAVFTLNDKSSIYIDADLNSHCEEVNDCKVTLRMQNISNQKLSMDFRITTGAILTAFPLDYRGQITIPAGETVDLGQISNECIFLYFADYDAYGTNILYY